MRNKDFVYFPVKDTGMILTLLNDIPFRIQRLDFPKRSLQEPLEKYFHKKYPELNWEEISLKFDQFGEIAVLKLDPSHAPIAFRKQVGELIISRYPRLKTVLNKIDVVEGIKRIYPAEHLAGEEIWHSWHQEYGVFIYVDLQRAYFNPRLAEEHHRVAMSIEPGEKVLDLFTGVGPFALHCAKSNQCDIIAIDINPFAIFALQKSMKRNKLLGYINPIIGDSRNVLQFQRHFDRVIINLPQKSAEFLPYAAKLLKKGGIITFYQFISKLDNPEEEIRNLIAQKLANINSYKELNLKAGREVSPSRVQYNIDLQLY
jgi:tRNA (guanine37-N1)-methyltransferase